MVRTTAKSLKGVNSLTDLPLFERYFQSQALDFRDVFSLMKKIHEEFLQPLPCAGHGLRVLIRYAKSRNFYCTTRTAVGGTTPHSMERKLNGDSFKKTSTGKYENAKKWMGYDNGRNVPQLTTVRKAEKIAGCSLENELLMVLWDALDIEKPFVPEEMLRRLSPSVRKDGLKAFAALKEMISNPRKDVFATSHYYCLWICRRGSVSLSSITVITILYRYAVSKGDDEIIDLMEEELVIQLMFLSVELHQRGIFRALVSIYLEHIFALNLRFRVNQSPTELAKSAIFLNLLVFTAPQLRGIPKVSFEERQEVMDAFRMGELGCWPSEALRITHGYVDQKSSEVQRIYPDPSFAQLTQECWESVAKVLSNAYRSSSVLDSQLSEELNLNDFLLLKSEIEATLQQAGHYSSPLANWWSIDPPRAESCTIGLEDLLKREWPQH